MATLYRDPNHADQRPAYWLETTHEEAERAWAASRVEWGHDDAEDTAPLFVTLGATHCGVFAGDDEEHANQIDEPATPAAEMLAAFGLTAPPGAEFANATVRYQPRAARYCEVVAQS